MMLRALEILADIRKRGAKPEVVLLDIGSSYQRKWWAEDLKSVTVAVPDTEPLRDLDLRPLVGCDVVAVAITKNIQRVRDVTALLCQQAGRVTVFNCNDNPDNLGHEWIKGRGWRKFSGVNLASPCTAQRLK